MDGFTIIDGVVALVIIVSALLAYARGFVREALAIAGWVVSGLVAFTFAPQAQPLVKEIPGIGPMLADSCELSIIAAFAAVFAVALVISSLFTPLFSSVVQRSAYAAQSHVERRASSLQTHSTPSFYVHGSLPSAAHAVLQP